MNDANNDKKDDWKKTEEVANRMQKIGCLMTLFITIPIIIMVLLVMCSR